MWAVFHSKYSVFPSLSFQFYIDLKSSFQNFIRLSGGIPELSEANTGSISIPQHSLSNSSVMMMSAHLADLQLLDDTEL